VSALWLTQADPLVVVNEQPAQRIVVVPVDPSSATNFGPPAIASSSSSERRVVSNVVWGFGEIG
jgi:hypothetical protein